MAKPSAKEARKPSRKRIRLFAAVGVALCLLSGFLPPVQGWWQRLYEAVGFRPTSSEGLTITFLDVGSADAAIISSPECAILIDGGTYDCGQEIYRHLFHMGIDHLDLMVNTHPDKDHLGGFSQVLAKIPVEEYWEPELPAELTPETEEYRLVRKALKETQTPVRKILAGEKTSFGDLALEVLSPTVISSDTNNNSLVIRITYAGRSILMMGDAEEKQEQELLDQDLSCDVLKVGHHGSNTSTGEAFLAKTLPEYAVISAGQRRPPDDRVLERLEKAGVQIFRTDTQGDITLTIESGEISISPENTA